METHFNLTRLQSQVVDFRDLSDLILLTKLLLMMISTPICLTRSSCLAILITFALGCNSNSNPKTYKVSGTVTYKGKPVDDATVVFVPTKDKGFPATGVTDKAGNFLLTSFVSNDGAVPGAYSIKVSKLDYKDADAANAQIFQNSEEESASYQLDEGSTKPVKNLIPEKFSNPTTSGLTYTVPESESTYDIELK
ncbi:MAG: carboxypeptidase-like regulatory domain-containing protein [Pirellula sp.]|jgi:hypothetical protein